MVVKPQFNNSNSTFPILNSSGGVQDRTKTQEEEKLRLQVMQSVLDMVPTIAVVLDPNNNVVLANKKFFNSFAGDNLEDVIGAQPGKALRCVNSDEVPEGCGSGLFCKYCGARSAINKIRANSGVFEQEYQLIQVNDDNEEVVTDFLATVTPVEIPGLDDYVFLSLKNISAEKRSKMHERIFFHDLLNTAGGMHGYIEYATTVEDSSEYDIILSDLLDSSSQLLAEIKSHRDLLRAEKGELVVEFASVDLNNLLKSVCSTMQKHKVFEGKTLKLLNNISNCVLNTDLVILKRVLINLIKNAAEASSNGQSVIVDTSLDGDLVNISIHNQCVMSEEAKMHIFKRSYSTKGANRGLGTYSVKLLTEKYLKGNVSFKSEKGKGTTFIVSLSVQTV